MLLQNRKYPWSFLLLTRRLALPGCVATASAFFALTLAPVVLAGAIISADPGNYRSLLGGLQAGDTLQLASGIYDSGLPIIKLNGDPGNPIIITGPTSGAPAVLLGDILHNTVQINNSSYVTVRYLKLDGQQLPYVDAVNCGGASHHITIENLLIVNHGGSSGPDTDHQLTVGINTKATAWDWVIRRNTIIGAGTGMYLGAPSGGEPFVRGLIEYNLIIDTLGYNIEIKHQNTRPLNLGLPTGDNKTVIRYNVFSKANNASVGGAWARPNLLVGHWPLSGDGSNDVYEIYGNFFYQNPADALFQGEGNIAMYDNLLVNRSGSAINIRPHNDMPRRINVFHNTIVATDTGIRVTGADSTVAQWVTGNAVFAPTPISSNSGVTVKDNVTAAYSIAVNYLVDPHVVLGSLDLSPVANVLRGVAIDMTVLQGFGNAKLDFNGAARDGVLRGAYGSDVKNTGWVPKLELRPEVVASSTPTPTPKPSPTPSTTPTPTAKPSPTPTPTLTPSPTPTPSMAPSPTPTPALTPTPSAGPTPTPTSKGGAVDALLLACLLLPLVFGAWRRHVAATESL